MMATDQRLYVLPDGKGVMVMWNDPATPARGAGLYTTAEWTDPDNVTPAYELMADGCIWDRDVPTPWTASDLRVTIPRPDSETWGR